MKHLFLIVVIHSFSLLSIAGSLDDAKSEYALAIEDEKANNFQEAYEHIENAIKGFTSNASHLTEEDMKTFNKVYASRKNLWHKTFSNPEKLKITKEMNNEVYESVFKTIFKSIARDELDRQAGMKKRTVFLAISENAEKLKDLEPELIAKFKDMDIFICQYSEAEMPNVDKVIDNKHESVKHKVTKTPGTLLYVKLVGWIDENTVKVDVGVYDGPLAGHGYSAVFKKDNNVWTLKEKLFEWVS